MKHIYNSNILLYAIYSNTLVYITHIRVTKSETSEHNHITVSCLKAHIFHSIKKCYLENTYTQILFINCL